MRKYLWLFCVVILFLGCRDEKAPDGINLRAEMRSLVMSISQCAKAQKPGFIIMPQNGVELVSKTGLADGSADEAYLAAIDAINKEDLLGLNKAMREQSLAFMKTAYDHGLPVFGIEYLNDDKKIDEYNQFMADLGYIGFGSHAEFLDQFPTYPTVLLGENHDTITDISQVHNAVYVLTTAKDKKPGIKTKSQLIEAVTQSNYDMLVTDLDLDAMGNFTPIQIEQMRPKRDGGRRLILCYLSIGQAEYYRSYFDREHWEDNPPEWLRKADGHWDENYYVWYWANAWQDIMYRDANSQLNQIIAAGFDGVFLDKVDAFYSFRQ